MQIHPAIYISLTPHKGKGVFTATDIDEGSVIEIAQVIIIPEDQKTAIHRTVLHDYYFDWEPENKRAAIALGFGSLYNHSNDPNADYDMNYHDRTIVFKTLQDIKAGEEITISYINNHLQKTNLWFDVKN